MMQVQIKFTANGCSSMTGNFAAGDLLRTSADLARHFVEDAKCAKYVGAPSPSPVVGARRAKAKPGTAAG